MIVTRLRRRRRSNDFIAGLVIVTDAFGQNAIPCPSIQVGSAGGEPQMEETVRYYYGKDPRSDKWRWQLQADNKRVIAISADSYNHEADCVKAIERVRNSSDAEVRKLDPFWL